MRQGSRVTGTNPRAMGTNPRALGIAPKQLRKVLRKIKAKPAVEPRERKLPRWLRFEILKRDGFRCRYCGAKGVPLQVDHITPVVAGGLTEPKNLTTACDECNGGKGGVPLDRSRL